ncbi:MULTISPECIES: YoaK family protein [unclassified Mesorhizobium]|uniref:YoaK family protein n=1 Tax=unclassified Mesorhizobium TaxID=325217 RepID=UPI000F762ACA|nr:MULTISPECIES: YoaK family protein [unclassified Mesorhizobium]AZO06047.1 DUF1275 domain-containing protein [Mesorhizobium sp. M2A.F.Ca.ET.043.02.1.1]RUW68206.1 DUF1275 domain-containing protein [Mesorhizobium sp. M2A.F.Ca.ET.067.02.1.1]RWC14084.1 MAG: DUF1275 domain-containing protein [Mesorhizobium sp.]TIV34654.1 MAG: DUF1275 domain-containing protein [Mesorhizobium sp.]
MAGEAKDNRAVVLPLLLGFNGGYVDTMGFLALQGLFTAHVTGNFVTLGASLALGTSGALSKLLALPVFCAVVILSRLLSNALRHREAPVFRYLLTIKLVLLIAAAVLAVRLGPFPDGDHWAAIVTGMILVSAMAVQNAAHRVHLASLPPSTLMTGTTTQIMLDLADLIYGSSAADTAASRSRLARMSGMVAVFALGCGTAALLHVQIGVWSFAAPPVVALLALIVRGSVTP